MGPDVMDIPTVHPNALRRGDAVGVIAPAGTVDERDSFEAGLAALERLGFRVRYDERIFNSLRYLAGDDAARAEEIHKYFEDPEIRAVLGLRGGFGSSRLIPLLDERRLRQRCKLFMGFSDLTTLHLYFRRRFGWVTVHGPMITSQSLAQIGAEAGQHLLSLWTDPSYLPRFDLAAMESWSSGVAEGVLTGGCLSLIVASLSTPYEIKTEGKVLFLEDFGEEPYRLDRMLTHLKLAGKLDRVAGVLLGSFEKCERENGGYTAAETLREILGGLDVPVLANFPAGHGPQNWPIPLGVKVRLDSVQSSVEFLESAVV